KDKKARGMGIGLSLVKKIIESYNGKIWVENRIKNNYEQGSNFVILIPELK
ncbi:MAG: ATP-binding protein, partial [Promethearchaeota archaeon]